MQTRYRGGLYLSVAFVLAGSSVVAARFLTDSLPPFTTTFMSLAVAVATAVLFAGKKMAAALPGIPPAQWRILALQALFGVFLFRVFLTVGLGYTSAVEAGIITGTSPAITATLTWLLLREPLRARTVGGIALTTLGVLLLQGFPFHMAAFSRYHLLGNLLALCAAASESLFTTLSRKNHLDSGESHPLDPLVQAGIVSAAALALCLVPMLLERPAQRLAALSPAGWAALVWYGSMVTVVAFACMFAGARRCDGYTIASFTGLLPLSSLVLAVLLLGEGVGIRQLGGCACIVAAILVMGGRRSPA